ncbi:MAG: propionyl-CoA synthetase, partial [Sulfurospirillaceae bacterium]|nr:propionyl-CoA synthetase [Sulfurospirillaceae bacterium]
DVAECAVIGVDDELKGEVPMAFVVLKDGIERDLKSLADGVVQLVREEIGAVAALKLATVVNKLPKTRSGKILRGTMRSMADGKEWSMPSTIEDESVLEEIQKAIGTLGYPQLKKGKK